MQGNQNIVEGDTGDHQRDWVHFSDCEVVSYFIEHDSATVLHILPSPWSPTVELRGGRKWVFLSSPSGKQTRIYELPSSLLLSLFQFLLPGQGNNSFIQTPAKIL